MLPEYHKFDIDVDIQERMKMLWGPIYSFSDPKLKNLQSHSNEELVKEFSQPFKSPTDNSMFYMKKRSGDICPVIDCLESNVITIKNRYPLPLIHMLLHHFLKHKCLQR